MHFERQPRQTQAISLTPLIDVVFLLIVFFMLSTSFTVSESIELSLPEKGEASLASAAEKIETTRITIIDKNLIYMDGKPIPPALLRQSVNRLLNDNADLRVVLETAKNVSVQQLVDVMDMVYLIGGKHLSIAKWQPQVAPALEKVDISVIKAPSDMELGRYKPAPPKAHPSGFLRLPEKKK